MGGFAAAREPGSFLRTYAGRMTQVIAGPRMFFRAYDAVAGGVMPVFALALSGAFYAVASLLTYTCPQPLAALGIFFVNAAGIPLAASGIGYLLLRLIFGSRRSFGYVFGIYAYASAAALLIAWTPYVLLLAEFWRWWLTGTGLILACGLKRWQALLVVGLTIGSMIFGYIGVMSRLM